MVRISEDNIFRYELIPEGSAFQTTTYLMLTIKTERDVEAHT